MLFFNFMENQYFPILRCIFGAYYGDYNFLDIFHYYFTSFVMFYDGCSLIQMFYFTDLNAIKKKNSTFMYL